MRLSRTDLFPMLTIVAGGALGVLVTVTALVPRSPSEEVSPAVRHVPIPSPDVQPRVVVECDDDYRYRLIGEINRNRDGIETPPPARWTVAVQCADDGDDRRSDGDEEEDLSAAPAFTPMTVRPEIRNRSEVQAALMNEYPTILRDAGIGGTVIVWMFISEEGEVLNRRVSETSGHVALDQAALEVADVFRFTPALNRERTVPVWIQLPITFQVR